MIHFGCLLAYRSSFSRFVAASCEKTIFFYSAGFSLANLSEQSLRAVIGVERVSH
jgi:hypothetical protein